MMSLSCILCELQYQSSMWTQLSSYMIDASSYVEKKAAGLMTICIEALVTQPGSVSPDFTCHPCDGGERESMNARHSFLS